MNKVLLVGILLVGCGKKSGGSSEPPPPKPSTGAPLAFVVKSVKAGGDHGGTVDTKAYNFSDKTIAQYMVLVRYYDASGAVLKVKPGTPFEKDTDFTSMSGMKYSCPPKSWCDLKLEMLDVPDKAVKADVLAQSVTAIKGNGFEDAPLFKMNGMDWPKQ